MRLGLLLSRMVCAPVCYAAVLAPLPSTWPAHVLESRPKFSRISGTPTAFIFSRVLDEGVNSFSLDGIGLLIKCTNLDCSDRCLFCAKGLQCHP